MLRYGALLEPVSDVDGKEVGGEFGLVQLQGEGREPSGGVTWVRIQVVGQCIQFAVDIFVAALGEVLAWLSLVLSFVTNILITVSFAWSEQKVRSLCCAAEPCIERTS